MPGSAGRLLTGLHGALYTSLGWGIEPLWTATEIAALYRRHAFAVTRRCRRLLRSDEEARDVTQEVFLKALENPAAFRGSASPATFFFAAATHLCLQRLRNRSIRDPAWVEAVGRDLESQGGQARPDAELAGLDLWRSTLAEADDATRAMVLYHFFDGLSQGEIAELLGLSRVTVNQRLQRWRAQAMAKVAVR